MFNFSIISIISLILVYQNILLLNEETLILVCFLIFCLVAVNKFSETVYIDLKHNSKQVEDSLNTSFNNVIKSLEANLEDKKSFQKASKNFEVLGNHFFKLSSAISNELPYFVSKKSESIYSKKLIFIQRLEKQAVKLLALLISKKLNQLVLTQKFYTYNLKVTNFLCFRNITLLKYLTRV